MKYIKPLVTIVMLITLVIVPVSWFAGRLSKQTMTRPITNSNVNTNITTPTTVPSPSTKTSTITSSPINTKSNQCIVTIDSVQYDVTTFKNMHSGGDIFVCGTDMSQTFWAEHSARELRQMQRYRIN